MRSKENSIKKIIYIASGFFIFLFSTLAHAQNYTLEKAVVRALEANPGLEAKLLVVEKAKMDVGVAQSSFWPHVSLVSSQNRLNNAGSVGSIDDFSNKSSSQGVRATLSLFAGFMHLNSTQKSFLAVDMEKARHQQAKLELISNVQLQYLELLRAREDMKIVKESKKRIGTQLDAAKAFVAVGMAPYLNILQNEVEMSKAQQQEIRVANAIRNATVKLNSYLNLDESKQINYLGTLQEISGFVSYTEEQAVKTAMFSRPDLIIAQKAISIAMKDSDITKGKYLPTVNANYENMQFSKNFDNKMYNDYSRSYWAVGINVSWEFFDGGSTTFTYLSDKKRVESLKKDYENLTSTVSSDVIRSLLDISSAKELISAARKGVESALESYRIANKRYETHIGTITELLDAQLKLTQAEGSYSQALFEYNGARVKFYYSIGRENIALQ